MEMQINRVIVEKYTPQILFLFFLIIYLLFISEIPSLTHDSITYANEIESGEVVLHPHHLLYHVLSLLWYKLLIFLSFGGTALAKIASLNAFFGAAGIAVIYKILKDDLRLDIFTSISMSAIAGFSFGYWFYSVSVEVYIIPLFFILLAIHQHLSGKRIVYIAISAGMAALFHQQNVLFGIAVVIALFLKDNDSAKKLRNILIFIISYSLVILIPYLLSLAILNISSIQEISYWLTKYHHEVNSWNSLSPAAILVKDLVGFSRALVSSYGMFQIDFVMDILQQIFPDKNFFNEQYLLRNTTKVSNYLYVIFMIIFLLSYLYLIIKTSSKIKMLIKNKDLHLLLLTILIYTIFFSFWDSANVEFWIPQVTLLWILIAYAVRSSKLFISILLAIVFLLNFFWAIIPARNINNDYYYAYVESANELYDDKKYVILKDIWIKDQYFVKYSKLRLIHYKEESRSQFSDILKKSIISPDVFIEMNNMYQSTSFIKQDVNGFTWYITKDTD